MVTNTGPLTADFGQQELKNVLNESYTNTQNCHQANVTTSKQDQQTGMVKNTGFCALRTLTADFGQQELKNVLNELS